MGNDQLHWTIDTPRGPRSLDLIPAVVGSTVSVEVDGRTVSRLPKPSARHPWTQVGISVDGTPLDIGLTVREFAMWTDVFRDGRSLRDRRTLDAAIGAAPQPVSGYESWFGVPFTLTKGSPRLRVAVALVAVGASTVLLLAAARATGAVAAAAFLVAVAAILLGWVWSWLAATVTAHRFLLRHADWGDYRRALLLCGSFAGYGVATLALGAAGLLLAQALAGNG